MEVIKSCGSFSDHPSLAGEVPPSRKSNSRLVYIDALRGLAILYIFLYHLALLPQPNLAVPGWAKAFVLTGGTGVTLFFVMSAFCLCLSMRTRAQEDNAAVRFYLRRLFRIVPLYYSWLIVSLVRDKYWFGVSHSWSDILLNISLLFNFVPGKHDGIVWASWILSVEVAFYVLFPLLYRYVNDMWKSAGFFVVALIVAELYKTFVNAVPIVDSQRAGFLHMSFLHQLPIFALGMFVYFLYERFVQGKLQPRSLALVVVGAAVFGYVSLLQGKLNILLEGYYWQGIIYGALLVGLSIYPFGMFVNRATGFYGRISYSVYLNHPTLIVLLVPLYRIFFAWQLPTTLQFGACVVVTLMPLTVLSLCSHYLIETPGIRLGNWVLRKLKPFQESSLRVEPVKE